MDCAFFNGFFDELAKFATTPMMPAPGPSPTGMMSPPIRPPRVAPAGRSVLNPASLPGQMPATPGSMTAMPALNVPTMQSPMMGG